MNGPPNTEAAAGRDADVGHDGDPLDENVSANAPIADAAADSAALRRMRRRSTVLAVGLLGVLTVLSVSIARSPSSPWFQALDERWNTWTSGHRFGTATWIATSLSVVGSVWVMAPLRFAVVLILLLRRRWTQLGAFVMAVVVSEVAIGTLKAWLMRPRPSEAMVATSGYSFPSGHAVAAAVTAFGVVVAFVPRGRRRWRWITAATVIAASMAWSRTYLSAHWATDTIAGTALGVSVALLSEALFEGGRRVVAVSVEEL